MSVQLCPMARSSRISSSTARWASTCCAASMRNLSQPSLCGRWDRGWAGGTTLSTIRDPDAGPRETGNSHGRARADPGPSCVTTPTAAGSCTAMAPRARASRRAALARLLRPMVALPCNGSRRGPMCQPTPRAEGSPCRNLPTRRRRLAICKPGARRSQRATGGSPRESRRSGRPRSSETPSRGDDQPPADFLPPPCTPGQLRSAPQHLVPPGLSPGRRREPIAANEATRRASMSDTKVGAGRVLGADNDRCHS
jgi:hypothetical protein